MLQEGIEEFLFDLQDIQIARSFKAVIQTFRVLLDDHLDFVIILFDFLRVLSINDALERRK